MAPSTSAARALGMPEGPEAVEQVARRRRRGRLWLALFQGALLIAILALIALLFNIFNGIYGLAAVENVVNPADLVARAVEQRMVALPATTTSEDDEAIAAGVAADPNAVGLLGFHYYQEHSDTLKLVDIEGVTPSAETVESGAYPLSRPLYLYVSRRALKQNPAVANFVYTYLDSAATLVEEEGYFALDAASLQEQVDALLALNEEAATQATAGDVRMAGSSTLYPLTARVVELFTAAGFTGTAEMESGGTRTGIVALCTDQDVEIAAASRALTAQEIAACEEMGVTPIAFRVGSDAIAVVAGAENDFLTNLTLAEVQTTFGSATSWDEVNSSYPAEAVMRYMPGLESGTLDFFTSSVFDLRLSDLSNEELIAILDEWLSVGVMRRYASEEPMAERSTDNLLALVEERVVQPTVVASWNFSQSLFNRDAIEAEVLESHPNATLQWWQWLNRAFLGATQSSVPEQAGVRTAILGSLWVIFLTMLIAVPIGIGSAIYLEEYAGHSRLHQIIQTNIDNLAGVPSIIYGILGLTVFVRVMEPITSGAAFSVGDDATANGRTILSAALTLALLVLPVVIINAQEAIRAVPKSLREAGFGLGATKWQVTWTHVLSNALPGIFTGTILAMSRALGETAPLIVVGASTYITTDPTGPFSKFTVLPMQIYQWTSRPQDEFRHIAAAASVVLIVLLLLLNGTAIWLRNRYGKKL